MRLVMLLIFTVAGPAVAESLDVALGKALFNRVWVSAPASTDATDGLGPLFNARACASCHRNGGRGRPNLKDLNGTGLVLRLGRADGAGDPVYGAQLQTDAIQGHAAEGRIGIDFKSAKPIFQLKDLAYGPLDKDTRLSARIAPALYGLGLLERVSDATLLALADPDDRDHDGITGRPNWLSNVTSAGARRLGRYGWKAASPDLIAQTARALRNDLGLSSPEQPYQAEPYHAGDCTAAQSACLMAPNGASRHFDDAEVSREMLRLIATYVGKLPAPSAASGSEYGAAVFHAIGCAACHRLVLALADGGIAHAYTDLLLHDLGPALADGVVEGSATGSEWRTAPLWGLGRLVAAGAPLLHDGRARSLPAAILWHNGEAQKARDGFLGLPAGARAALLEFLASL